MSMPGIEHARKLDKACEILGLQVNMINHVDAPDVDIFCTQRNAQAERVHINYQDNNHTLRDYQTLKRLNPDKEFVLYL